MRDAFVRLILSKGYDAISIQDIATEAQAARITFYRHYRDKEELLIDCLNTLYEELAARTAKITIAGLADNYSPARVLYEHIEAQETLYRILFSSRGTHTVVERLRHHLANYAMQTVMQTGRQAQGAIPLEVIAYHAASAQLGLAIWWLDHNKPYPLEYMSQISTWLTLSGLLETFQVSDLRLPVPQL